MYCQNLLYHLSNIDLGEKMDEFIIEEVEEISPKHPICWGYPNEWT
jgi:hypothetical protein